MEPSKGFVVAGTHSGSGKTTVTLGIMAWLRRKGYQVAPFKVGPDFIDPGHHTRITGMVSRNLDGWMLSKAYNMDMFHRYSNQADIAVVEGVMGLYDGYDGKSDAGSTAQMAKWLNLPVILVVNAQSMARSAAALVNGFVSFDPDLAFAGVVFNNLGSEHHLSFLADAMKTYVDVPLLGGILRDRRILIPERHLGLVTDDEHTLSDTHIDLLADTIGSSTNMTGLLPGSPSAGEKKKCVPELSSPEKSVRIGVARDEAFCFYYQDNLDMLTSMGASLEFFSPLEDKTLPDDLSGLYFGGGYPEVFAKRLSENTCMRQAVKKASDSGMPVYGECGGFMYLCRHFRDKENQDLPMTNCFPFVTHLLDRLKALGYREVTLDRDTIIGPKGTRIRGHEFHYSEVIGNDQDVEQVYGLADRKGSGRRKEGFVVNQTLGSYVHLHFGSQPQCCRDFVASCSAYGESRKP